MIVLEDTLMPPERQNKYRIFPPDKNIWNTERRVHAVLRRKKRVQRRDTWWKIKVVTKEKQKDTQEKIQAPMPGR